MTTATPPDSGMGSRAVARHGGRPDGPPSLSYVDEMGPNGPPERDVWGAVSARFGCQPRSRTRMAGAWPQEAKD